MSNVFLTSDTHFGHKLMTTAVDKDGNKIRPWDDPEQMNQDMIESWNSVVGPKDKVYHLGDVVINRRYLSVLEHLNGDKVLIKGNHDLFKLPDYTKYFRDIRAYWPMNKFVLSHIPVHPNQFSRWKGNIHGHLHHNELDDPRYMNVCVEKTDYRPISFEEVMARYRERGIE